MVINTTPDCRCLLYFSSPQSLSVLIWSLGKLGYQPAGSSLAPWLTAAVTERTDFHTYSSDQLVLLLSGLRYSRVVMNSRWTMQLIMFAQQHAAELTLQVRTWWLVVCVCPKCVTLGVSAWKQFVEQLVSGHSWYCSQGLHMLTSMRKTNQLTLVMPEVLRSTTFV